MLDPQRLDYRGFALFLPEITHEPDMSTLELPAKHGDGEKPVALTMLGTAQAHLCSELQI